MYKIAAFVFYLTCLMYVFTLVMVTYVGVYLTYIALPVIVISGIIMRLARKKANRSSGQPDLMDGFLVGMSGVVSGINKGLNSFNTSVERLNLIEVMVFERTKLHKKRIQQLNIEKAEVHADFKAEEFKLGRSMSRNDVGKYQKKLDILDLEIQKKESEI
jgi:hypothetical protein